MSDTTTDVLSLTDTERQLLGQRLREQRLHLKQSADEVAAGALGYANGHSTILRLEKGASPRPKRSVVHGLAKHFGLEPAALLDFSANGAYLAPGAALHGAEGHNGNNGHPAPSQSQDEHIASEGEDMRHDPLGWTSTRAHAPRYVRR